MKNIIEIYCEWTDYQKQLDYRSIVYYQTIFKCASERKGIIINLMKEHSKNTHYKHEKNIIMKHIRTIPFSIDYDIFELKSRILCEYFQKHL